jgi:hypothetical protein
MNYNLATTFECIYNHTIGLSKKINSLEVSNKNLKDDNPKVSNVWVDFDCFKDENIKILYNTITKSYDSIINRLLKYVIERDEKNIYNKESWYWTTDSENADKVFNIINKVNLNLWHNNLLEPISVTPSGQYEEYVYLMTMVVTNKLAKKKYVYNEDTSHNEVPSHNESKVEYICDLSSDQENKLNYRKVPPYEVFKYFDSSGEIPPYLQVKIGNATKTEVNIKIKSIFRDEFIAYNELLKKAFNYDPLACNAIKNAPEHLVYHMCVNYVQYNLKPVDIRDFFTKSETCIMHYELIKTEPDDYCSEIELTESINFYDET